MPERPIIAHGQRRKRHFRGNQPPQQPPPQHPPPPPPAGAGLRPPTATVVSSLTVSSCPAGQSAGAPDSLMGRVTSKVSPHWRHRKS